MRWPPKRRTSRVEILEARITELERELESRTAPIPGADAAGPASVRVGGREVDVLPLPPAEWLKASGELPSFLLAYAAAKVGNRQMAPVELEKLVETVRGWLRVCGRGDMDLERLSVPEAGHAVVVIARVNGLDEALQAAFKRGLDRAAAGPGSATLRHEPERAPQA